MGKEFTGYFPEATQYVNDKITLSITCLLEVSKPNRFAELLDSESKIKIGILDHSDENVEPSPRVVFNMTVEEFEFIYDYFMNGRLALPHNKFKALQKPLDKGNYKGYWYSSAFSLEYIQGYNNPWKISITNGYGKEQGTFDIKKTQLKTLMNEEVLHKLLSKTKEYINTFRILYCRDNISNGLRECAKTQKGSYDPFKENNNIDLNENVNPENMMAENISSNQTNNNAQNNQTTTNSSKNSGRILRPMKMQVTSLPMAFENSFICSVLIGGMQYPLYSKEAYPELITSFNDKTIVEANLFDYNGKLCLDSFK